VNTRRVLALARKDLKRMIREPASLFMFILFPVVLTLVFGLTMGGIGGDGTSFEVGYVDLDLGGTWDEYLIGNLSAMEVFDLVEYQDNESASEDLKRGNIHAFIVIPEDFGTSAASYWASPNAPSSWVNASLSLYIDAGSMTAIQTIPPIVDQVLEAVIFGEVPKERSITINSPSLVASREFDLYDSFVPGLFAYAVIFIVMEVGQSMTTDREKGLLRRVRTTPTTSSEYIAGHTISNMCIACLQVFLVFTMALVMGFSPLGGTLSLVMAFVIVVVFSLCCVGFGLVTASVAKTPGSATGMAFIFILPMMFLGTFLPQSPNMEVASQFVPSWWVTDALVSMFLRGLSPTSPVVLQNLVVVAAWSIASLLLGIVVYDRFGSD
jgi:ABC-2 type transport system permease protein